MVSAHCVLVVCHPTRLQERWRTNFKKDLGASFRLCKEMKKQQDAKLDRIQEQLDAKFGRIQEQLEEVMKAMVDHNKLSA